MRQINYRAADEHARLRHLNVKIIELETLSAKQHAAPAYRFAFPHQLSHCLIVSFCKGSSPNVAVQIVMRGSSRLNSETLRQVNRTYVVHIVFSAHDDLASALGAAAKQSRGPTPVKRAKVYGSRTSALLDDATLALCIALRVSARVAATGSKRMYHLILQELRNSRSR